MPDGNEILNSPDYRGLEFPPYGDSEPYVGPLFSPDGEALQTPDLKDLEGDFIRSYYRSAPFFGPWRPRRAFQVVAWG